MPKYFEKKHFFRLSLISLLTLFVLHAHFAQNRPQPENPTPNLSPNQSSVEIDDESLLTFLLSEKSRNLHQWGAVTQFHGLPSDRVNAIAQTADGVLWFGTDLGLAKFDGRRVETVAAANFSNPRILVLKADSLNRLWIGTQNGAFRFSQNRFEPLPQTAGAPINSIVFGENNQTFLGSENGFVIRISPQGGNDLDAKIVFEKDFPVKSLVLRGPDLLIGTHSGGLFSLANEGTEEILARPRLFFINALAAGAKGDLWLGGNSSVGESGLFTGANLRDYRRVGENLGSVNALVFDEKENLLIGTRGNGAFLFRGADELKHFTFENTAGGLRANEILSVFVDRESVYWFGTAKGISRFDPHSFSGEQFSLESRSNFIRAIFQSADGRIFAGTQRGLFVSENQRNWRPIESLERKTVYSIAEIENGRLALGTVRGLSFYPSKTSAVAVRPAEENWSESTDNQTPAGSVRSIQPFQNKTFLAVFGQGLATLEGTGAKLVSSNAPQIAKPTSLKSDGDRRLWIGTAENGVFFFDGSNILADPQLDSLKNNPIWAIEGTEKTGLWFGTENGLFLFADGALETVSENIAVRGIALAGDGNGVWCATDRNGLMRVAADRDFGWISSRLDVEQGLPSQRVFTISKLFDGTLLIGTNRGIVRYQPPKTQPILLPTRILSRRIHAPEELNSVITLDYPQNTLTLDVSAVSSRTFPEQFQYAFLLRDEKNQIIRKKFGKDAQFLMDNLPAGNFRGEVRAFDKNLISAAPLFFQFKVENPPFPWVTLALTILLLLALVALVWAIYSQKRIFRQSAELKHAHLALNSARLDLANEAERERRRISQDLHDQTLADLRHLQLLADKLPQIGETAVKARIFRDEIESVSREIRRICEDLSPSVLENIGFAAALEWALSNSLWISPEDEKRFEIEFVFPESLEGKLPLSPGEQIQIYRIVQEVLSNIARHSEATEVKMKVEKSPADEFVLRIEDNGEFFEFDKNNSLKGRGLNNIKSRAKLIEAEISFARSSRNGTIFTLIKPLHQTVAIHN